MATKAKHERRKRALARFIMDPSTSGRFRTDDDYAVYFARKISEKAALQVAILAIEPSAA